MLNEIDSLFDALNVLTTDESRDTIIKSPIPYPGGKSRSIMQILENLPYRGTFIDVFGGGGSILLARHKSKLEVFNDIHSGVVAFFRVMRNPELLDKFCDWLDNTVYAREEFVWCKENWDHKANNDFERATRWYYMVCTSFGSMGRAFGRSIKGPFTNKMRSSIDHFNKVHLRFKDVIIEHMDWEKVLLDYDGPDAVFYLDPPYVDTYNGAYSKDQVMSIEKHRHMLDIIQDLQGFVALSGYPNPLYDSYKWGYKREWSSYVSIRSVSYTDNNKDHLKNVDDGRGHATECLWVKE